jgi:hypothetical protein
VPIDPTVFRQIENAIFDLQSSDFNNFDKHIKKLSRVLHSADLETVTSSLIDGIDIDAWIKSGEATQGGMVGTATLNWPSDTAKELGTVIRLIDRFAENGSNDALNFAHTFYYKGSDINSNLHSLVRQVFIPFARDFINHVKQMTGSDLWVRAAEAVAVLKPILTEYSARLRICERAHGGLIRARAEQFHQGQRTFHNHDIPKEFWWAEGHQALEQDWATGDFSTWIKRDSIQLKAFGVTFARADIQKLLPPPNSVTTQTVVHNEEDEQITSKLDSLVPSAALSYKQAILDLKDDSRVSFRGPALELREALREILDHLAPDREVTAAPGYVQEKDRAGPTMKQKVRFIMKKQGKRSSSDAPGQAVTAFEEAIAALTRAVYERSSQATHVASERQTVVQLRRYVVAILHEIIET